MPYSSIIPIVEVIQGRDLISIDPKVRAVPAQAHFCRLLSAPSREVMKYMFL